MRFIPGSKADNLRGFEKALFRGRLRSGGSSGKPRLVRYWQRNAILNWFSFAADGTIAVAGEALAGLSGEDAASESALFEEFWTEEEADFEDFFRRFKMTKNVK